DVAAEIEFVRPRPHVRAVPRDHEGEISLQANTHLGGCPSCRVPLLGREPLHVFVEQAVPLELMRGRRHGRRLAVAERPLPYRPRPLATALLAGAEERVVREPVGFCCPEALEGGRPLAAAPPLGREEAFEGDLERAAL